MPTTKLTKDAIKYIIKQREDTSNNHTFDDIRKQIIKKFDIEVLEQTVSRNYRKYKDNEDYKAKIIVKKNNEVNLKSEKKVNPISDLPKKAKRIDVPIIPSNQDSQDFNEDAGKNYDVNEFFN